MTKAPVANGLLDEKLIFDQSKKGRIGFALPALDVPERPLEELLGDAVREELTGFPEVTEHQVVRHVTRLSQQNFSIDTGMYPLGSCTVKPNPRVNEKIARLPGFAELHPYTDPSKTQGSFEVMWNLEQYLNEICGMDAFTLNPAAGAQGELTGLLIFLAAHEARGEKRTKVLIPDSAHGTNPASAVYCGFEAVEIPSGPNGIIEVETIERLMDADTAAIMLTNPNTLGLFEENILEIAEIVHKRGGFVYCDGANLNALLGIARPGDMGVDVLQINLHKTFSTPHGGGGPGAGPVGVVENLVPFLPVPRIIKRGDRFEASEEFPQSIGRIRTFFGSFAVLLRAYAYIRALGPDGLRAVADNAVLNANYILASLRDTYTAPFPDQCMHECILTPTAQQVEAMLLKQESGLSREAQDLLYGKGKGKKIDKNIAGQIAKRLMDYGLHAPTVNFPLVKKNALLIEPTEGETLEDIDYYIEVLRVIAHELEFGPAELILGAPHFTPVQRLDEVLAARKKDLRWRPNAE